MSTRCCFVMGAMRRMAKSRFSVYANPVTCTGNQLRKISRREKSERHSRTGKDFVPCVQNALPRNGSVEASHTQIDNGLACAVSVSIIDNFLVSRRHRPRQAKLFDPVADLIAVDAEQMAGVGLVAVRTLERLNHQLPLHLLEHQPARRQLEL